VEISLNAEESVALQHALRSYGSDLRMEIVDTDNPGFRRDLIAERSTLESVLARLDAAVEASTLRDAEGRAVVRVIGMWWALD
jgi:hypothetical protein